MFSEASFDVVDPRLTQGALRWRLRRTLRAAPLRQRLAVKLLPALLHANFQHADLKGEALGIEGILAPRGWAALSRAFGIPPPVSAPRGRRLVRAILAVPAGDRLDLLVVPTGLMGEFEGERFAQRLVGAEAILRRGGANVRVNALHLDRCTAADRARFVLFGLLVIGHMPDELVPSGERLDSATVASLVADAPTPLAALSWMLIGGELDAGFPQLLQDLVDEGSSVATLADPELFGAAVLARARDDKRLLEVSAVAASDAWTRRVARKLAGPAAPPAGGKPGMRRPANPLEPLLALGRDLAFAAVRAVRSLPHQVGAPARARLRAEVLAAGMPVALLPALRAAGTGSATRSEGPAPGGEQAFLRQLALGVRLGLRPSDELDPFWKRVATLLAEGDRRVLLVSAQMTDEPGPPMDPLNRGPRRKVALHEPLVVLLRPGGRPTARRASADDAVARLVLESSRGSEVEVVGTSGAAQPAVSRLVRVAKLCQLGATGEMPLAIEAGGRVLLVQDGKLHRYAVERFAARPRLYAPDPESPDLAPPTNAKGAVRRIGQSVDCLVAAIDAARACIIYTDPEGYHLREEVPLPFLEEHLQEAQVLLRQGRTPALLAVRVAGELDATRLRAAGAAARRMAIEVEGDLVQGLRVGVNGEWFGAGLEWGWGAAAASVMSQWPNARGGRFEIKAMDLTVHHEPAGALARLYARSVVTRRLMAHVPRST